MLDHNAALRQLANRLVGILHGCLKTRTLYDETTAWSHHTKINRPLLDISSSWDVFQVGPRRQAQMRAYAPKKTSASAGDPT